MSTAAVQDIPRQLSLPKFEGYSIPTARITFKGGIELKCTSQEDVELVKALKLGAKAKVTVEIEGPLAPMVLDARVTARGHRYRKQEESDSLVGTHILTINDVRDGDEPDEED